jgi:alkylation response protein AidB-like acyl-CoA dehydrogenase
LVAWLAATHDARSGGSTVDRALLGGAHADRLGFAFAAGYGEALRALVPELDGVTALCISEASGNHPKAIATTLVETEPGVFAVSGHKKWATVGSLASTLLVAASIGVVDGTNRLRLVRVAANAPGVTIVPMTATFVPEIPHAEVVLERVVVRAADVLPGDGYAAYVKPFRTVEDIHVHAALLGYLVGVTRRHALAHELTEQVLALAIATRGLAAEDRAAPELHVALAGVLALVTPVVAAVETAWAVQGGDEWQRWQRDRMLLGVAGSARSARRDKAWSTIA